MGKKNFQQTTNSLQKVGGKYGIVVSRSELSLKESEKCVSVPLEYFLLA